MRFLIVIGRRELYTYEWNEKCFKPQFIEGSEFFSINSGDIYENMKLYMEILANEKNLASTENLKFEIIECSETDFNTAVINALNGYVEEIHPLKSILKTTIKKLSSDKKLMIEKYGINYDGYSYKLKNDNLIQEEFDLLAYTIHYSELIRMMD